MRLSAKAIINWANVNDYSTANQWIIRSGEPNTLYFQLIDLDQAGLRYIAGVGVSNQPASIMVTFNSVDQANVLQIAASQDPNDGSIWSVPITALQTPFTGNVAFAVTQGTVVRNFVVLNMLSVEYPKNPGCDGGLVDVNVFSFNPTFQGGP